MVLSLLLLLFWRDKGLQLEDDTPELPRDLLGSIEQYEGQYKHVDECCPPPRNNEK